MSINAKLRFEVFKRDNFICQYCGKKTPEVILEADHIIPESKGGITELENLTTSCFECNRGKGASLLDVIIKGKDIHAETILLAERERQLAEYNLIREKIREREQEETELLRDYFTSLFNGYYGAFRNFPLFIIKKSLKSINRFDIMEYIDKAFFVTAKDSKGEDHHIAAAKYLAGILRNIARENDNGLG